MQGTSRLCKIKWSNKIDILNTFPNVDKYIVDHLSADLPGVNWNADVATS